ncbi:craniofacial development protein 1 isoform 3-T4 [Vipera latastei]
MSDSEDFSSGEDEDYLPSGEEYSEDDVSELIKEEEVEEEKQQQPDWKKCKKDAKGIAPRKRKKQHGLFLDLDEGESSKGNKSDEEEDGDAGESRNTHINENEERKKEDALWASFLSDVAQKPKAVSAVQTPCNQKHKTSRPHPLQNPPTPLMFSLLIRQNGTRNHVGCLQCCLLSDLNAKHNGSCLCGVDVLQTKTLKMTAAEKKVCKPQGEPKQTENNKITVTKVFDFAGEEVRVTKEVDPASKEAQQFLKQQEPKAATQTSHPTVSGVKRPSSMNSLLGKMGAKKQKMSTLEKSKLDWENFKEEEGIGDELAIHNRGKDGYLERRAFLERVDYRQFEHERDLRLSNMKP